MAKVFSPSNTGCNNTPYSCLDELRKTILFFYFFFEQQSREYSLTTTFMGTITDSLIYYPIYHLLADISSTKLQICLKGKGFLLIAWIVTSTHIQ